MNWLPNRRWLLHSRVKLFGLFCSLLLWFYVVTDRTFDHTIKIPIRVSDIPEGWILAKPIPDRAEVLFRGTGKTLLGIRNRTRIDLNLHGFPVDSSLQLDLGMVKGLSDDNPTRALAILKPLDVNIRLDRHRERKVPVRSGFAFSPREGYTLVGGTRFEPDSVLISGPATALGRVEAVYTTGREYRNLVRSLSGKADLVMPAPLMASAERTVSFQIDVQRIGERVFRDIPVQVRHVPAGLKVAVDPPVLSLKLQGGVDLLSGLKNEDVTAVIDYISSRRYNTGYPATLLLPQDVSFSDVSPRFFRLVVRP